MSWVVNRAPFDPNRTPALIALDSTWNGSGVPNFVPIAADKNTGAMIVELGGSGGSGITYSQPSPSTVTWTTASSQDAALSVNVEGMGTCTVTTVETGTTTTAGAITFNVYDGTNWWAIDGQQIGSYTVQSSYTLVNNTNVAWQFDVAGFQEFEVELTTAITGTGSPQVVVIVQPMAAPNDVTPTVGWGQRLDNVNDSITIYDFGKTYTHLTTTGTTTIKSGAGVMKGFVINTPIASTVLTFYDNTAGSGTTIAAVTLPATLLNEGPMTAGPLDIAYSTGLTVVMGTAASDVTISSR